MEAPPHHHHQLVDSTIVDIVEPSETDTLLKEEEIVITNDGITTSTQFPINIKGITGKNTAIDVTPDILIKDLKSAVKSALEAKDNQYVRLIYQGKMLNDETATLSSYKVGPDAFLHCAFTTLPPKLSCTTTTTSSTNDNDGDESDDDDENSRRGFDRLRSHLSREEVQALRSYFYPQLAQVINASEPVEGEDTQERIYRIEEEWMRAQGPVSEFALNVRPRIAASSSLSEPTAYYSDYSLLSGDTEGTVVDLIWGLLMGMLLGFILMFCVLDRSIPRRQKVGIVVGVCIHLIVSFMPRRTIPIDSGE